MKTSQRQADLQHVMHMRLFQNVAASNLQKLLKDFCAYELEAGEILLSPFQRNEHLFLLLEGELKVYLGSLDGNAVSTLNTGDCVGEISFLV